MFNWLGWSHNRFLGPPCAFSARCWPPGLIAAQALVKWGLASPRSQHLKPCYLMPTNFFKNPLKSLLRCWLYIFHIKTNTCFCGDWAVRSHHARILLTQNLSLVVTRIQLFGFWLFFYSSTKTTCLQLHLQHSDDPNQCHYHHGNRVSPSPISSSECTERGIRWEQGRRLPVVITLPESHQVTAHRMSNSKTFRTK